MVVPFHENSTVKLAIVTHIISDVTRLYCKEVWYHHFDRSFNAPKVFCVAFQISFQLF